MMASLFDRMGLSPRERRLATLLGAVVAALLVVAAPAVLLSVVYGRRNANEEMRAALSALQDARPTIRERQLKREAIKVRYQRRAPPLAGFLEQTASAQTLKLNDSVDRPEVPHGKRYVERHTVVHLTKANMGALARWLERIETSGNPVAITRLNIRKRSGETDSYDVEVGVSAYDRTSSEGGKKAERP